MIQHKIIDKEKASHARFIYHDTKCAAGKTHQAKCAASQIF